MNHCTELVGRGPKYTTAPLDVLAIYSRTRQYQGSVANRNVDALVQTAYCDHDAAVVGETLQYSVAVTRHRGVKFHYGQSYCESSTYDGVKLIGVVAIDEPSLAGTELVAQNFD